MVSPFFHEEMPKRIVVMVCGAAILCSTHYCSITCSLFHILSPLDNWNRCLVSSVRFPHPLGQLGLGHNPLFS